MWQAYTRSKHERYKHGDANNTCDRATAFERRAWERTHFFWQRKQPSTLNTHAHMHKKR